MSLLAQFDDLCRYSAALNSGVEEDFKMFVENQLECMRKWKKAIEEVKTLRSRITYYESTVRRLENESIHLKNLLDDANLAVRNLKSEEKRLVKTITVVRDIILSHDEIDNQMREKFSFLNSSHKPSLSSSVHLETTEGSVGSLNSISDFDQAYVDLENWGSSSYHQNDRFKERKLNSDSITLTEEKDIDKSKVIIINQRNKKAVEHTKSKVISTSVTEVDTQKSLLSFKDHGYDIEMNAVSKEESPKKHIGRNHQLVSKKVIRSAKCIVCRQSIGSLKRSLKCQVCGITFHPECISMLPVFCFPAIKLSTKGMAGTVADYVSSSSPMIPPLIFHCVAEIESRGLNEIGLYRIPSSQKDVRNIIDTFVSKCVIPSLDDVNIHTLCVAVKEFLSSLSEPLITRKSRQAFIDAAILNDSAESLHILHELVSALPQPNRDTLSFLILHWKKIAESPHCKMNAEVLARILGPHLIGYSTPATKTIEETTNQDEVMKRLLSISFYTWQSMMSVAVSPASGHSLS